MIAILTDILQKFRHKFRYSEEQIHYVKLTKKKIYLYELWPHTFAVHKPRGLSCDSTLNICQDIVESANLLFERGFGDSQ